MTVTMTLEEYNTLKRESEEWLNVRDFLGRHTIRKADDVIQRMQKAEARVEEHGALKRNSADYECLCAAVRELKLRAEAAEARVKELEADKKRLDWIKAQGEGFRIYYGRLEHPETDDKGWVVCTFSSRLGMPGSCFSVDFDRAIDMAMGIVK